MRAGAAPAAAQASRTRANSAPVCATLPNGTLNSAAYRAASRASGGPRAADHDRRARPLHRLGQPRRVGTW